MKEESAFTLVEVMVVVALMIVVLSLAKPAMNGILHGSQLTQACHVAVAQLGEARQAAITQNRSTEVRFCKCADSASTGAALTSKEAWRFRAIQIFAISDSGAPVPLEKVQYLPQGTIIDGGPALSSLFDPGKRSYNTAPELPLPRVNTNYSYYSIRFRPDGSTDADFSTYGSSQGWFLTVHNASDGDNLSAPPQNFATIQIDPVNGTVTTYRP